MPSPRRAWLLVANPHAHSGEAADHVDEAVRALARRGLGAQVRLTRPAGATVGDVTRALREETFEGVIALGGDGTFHEVANGLLRSRQRLPMGVIPAGTGNNQARSLGLPLGDVDAAAHVIAHGWSAPMDGGRLTGTDPDGAPLPAQWFFDSIGFGFSARALSARYADKAAVEDIPLLREVYRDALVYAGAVTRSLVASYLEDARFDAVITTEHGEAVFEDLVDLVVNNTRVYARAWVIDPRSRHDDGRMEVIPIHGRDEWLARAIVDLDGNPARAWLDAVLPDELPPSAKRFRITLRGGNAPIARQVDGEVAPPMGVAEVEVRKAALRVRAPLPNEG